MSTSAIDVSYTCEGSGPPLYMVHGIGSRKVTWDGLLPYLRDHFTCVRYDLRGHGDSPTPPLPYSLESLVADLEALRAKLGHAQIHVIGHSLGGMIGPAYARAHPSRCLSLSLLSTAAGRSTEDQDKLRAVIDTMRQRGVRPVLETLIQRWYTDAFIAARPDAIQNRLQQVLDTPTEVFLEVFRIYAETEMAPWLGELRCPCLVLTGELDGGCNPRLNRGIHDQLHHSKLVILAGLKHSILIEAADRVGIQVRDFLVQQLDSTESRKTGYFA